MVVLLMLSVLVPGAKEVVVMPAKATPPPRFALLPEIAVFVSIVPMEVLPANGK
jgi:hypothetical protein